MHAPDTIAEAVALAVVHAREMHRGPGPDLLDKGVDVVYEPRATTWLRLTEQPSPRGARERHCTFCLAGAVMARLLREGRAKTPGHIVTPSIVTFGPRNFTEAFIRAFHAIEYVRSGQWARAWTCMHPTRHEHALEFERRTQEQLTLTGPADALFRDWKALRRCLADLDKRVRPAIAAIESVLLDQKPART